MLGRMGHRSTAQGRKLREPCPLQVSGQLAGPLGRRRPRAGGSGQRASPAYQSRRNQPACCGTAADGSLCPSKAPIIGKDMPPDANTEAKKCRISCNRASGMPAASQVLPQETLILTRGTSGVSAVRPQG